ncbi:MAG: hypothetical protein AB1746_04675 [Candidatus Zixiibacteriota bacterium]
MFVWCAIMFFLGIAAFMDSLFNYGEIFRQINSVLFLLISLGVLIRTTIKMKAAKMENYESRIENLEMQLRAMKSERKREIEIEKADY